MMLRRSIFNLVFTVVLALMFGMSQQGALVHEISHFRDYTGTTSQSDDDGDDVDNGKAAPGHFCAKCAAFSALASAVGMQSFVLPLLANSFEPVSYSSSSLDRFTFLSYAARAPPALS